MAEISNEKKRGIAEDMYIRLGLTGREIAENLGVTEQTVSRWKKGREGERSWDDRRTESSLTPLKIKETLLKEAEKLARGEESGVKADQLSKIMAAIDQLDKKSTCVPSWMCSASSTIGWPSRTRPWLSGSPGTTSSSCSTALVWNHKEGLTWRQGMTEYSTITTGTADA